MIDLCVDLRDNSPLVKNNRVTCWILDMQSYVKANPQCALGKAMPLENATDFNRCLVSFLQTETGQGYLKTNMIFFD